MAIQGAINKVIGSAAAAATLSEKLKKDSVDKSVDKAASSGKDMKAAAKARREYQQKIKAISQNKEISEKARTRRIGKLLDEYKGGNDGK